MATSCLVASTCPLDYSVACTNWLVWAQLGIASCRPYSDPKVATGLVANGSSIKTFVPSFHCLVTLNNLQ